MIPSFSILTVSYNSSSLYISKDISDIAWCVCSNAFTLIVPNSSVERSLLDLATNLILYYMF